MVFAVQNILMLTGAISLRLSGREIVRKVMF